MKKTHFALVIGMTVLSMVTTSANAQLLAANSKAAINPVSTSEGAALAAPTTKAEAKLYKANFKAARDFNGKFKTASNVKWAVDENVISASFKEDGIQRTAVYNKNGHLVRYMKVYQQDKMPANLKSRVKKAYPSYTITSVQELEEGGITFYIVHLESDKDFKKLSVYEGEINVFQEFKKQ